MATGAALWTAASVLAGKAEAWDGAAYWWLAYPASLATAALLAFWHPLRNWRWALGVFGGQFLALVLRSHEAGSLWPLGLAAFGILSLPALLAARVASRAGTRRATSPDERRTMRP